MPVLSVPVTSVDVDSSDWQTIVAGIEPPVIYRYASTLASRSRELEVEGRTSAAAALGLLSTIGHMALRPEDPDGPFRPFWSDGGTRSPLPDDLDDNELDIVAYVYSATDDNELIARTGDLLWLRRQDHRAARRAVDSYLASAQKLEEVEEHSQVVPRLQRAAQLAARLGGRKGDLVVIVLEAAAEILRRRCEHRQVRWTTALLDFLLQERYGDLTEWATCAEILAEYLEGQPDHYQALEFWKRAVRGHARAGNNDGQREAQIRHAETYVRLADSHPSEMGKASFIRDAYEAYRQIPGTDLRRQELHVRLLRHQERSLGEMGTISTPVELAQARSAARSEVEGLSLMEAIYSLALITDPIEPAEQRVQVLAAAKNVPLQIFISAEVVNAFGRVVGTKPSALEDEEGAIKAEMLMDANRRRELDVSGLIDPARDQILSERPDISLRDIEPLLTHNAFVPSSRVHTFARGLLAGLRGDFLLATHLLIPQVENSLRYVLNGMGIITSGLDATNRRQNEQSMNTLLYDHKDALEQFFGPAVVYELQGLLVEPMGANLRNESMHGLMSDEAFSSAPGIYFWWLILHICCTTNLGALPEGYHREVNTPSGDSTVNPEAAPPSQPES